MHALQAVTFEFVTCWTFMIDICLFCQRDSLCIAKVCKTCILAEVPAGKHASMVICTISPPVPSLDLNCASIRELAS